MQLGIKSTSTARGVFPVAYFSDLIVTRWIAPAHMRTHVYNGSEPYPGRKKALSCVQFYAVAPLGGLFGQAIDQLRAPIHNNTSAWYRRAVSPRIV